MENIIPFSRYRSARSKKRLVKRDKEKQVRQLWERHKQVSKELHDTPLLPLAEPYQKGWKRFFVVRPDIKISAYGEFYESILKVINTVQYSETRKFLKKGRRRGKRIYLPREQRLKELSLYEWHSPKCRLTDRQRTHFIWTETYDSNRKTWQKVYEFADPWRYVLKIAPHMITHYRPVNIDLKREYEWLNYLIWENRKNFAIFQKKILCSNNDWMKYRQSEYEALQGHNPLKGLSRAELKLNRLMELE